MMVTNVFVLQDILEKIVNLALICVRNVHKLDAKFAIFVIFLIQIIFVVLALQIAFNVILKLNAKDVCLAIQSVQTEGAGVFKMVLLDLY